MDTQSVADPVEKVYDLRTRGLVFITTRAGKRVHMHGGCWVAPSSGSPPRMMVAFPKEFEGAELVEKGGAFVLNLVSEEQREWNDRFFAGRHHIEDTEPDAFMRSPSGCPVLKEAVAYFDCRLVRSIDLGDFLLVVGDVTTAVVLDERKTNLTVNEIIADADPRQEETDGRVALPFEGFTFDTSRLQPAPVNGAPVNGGVSIGERTFERVYAYREWGLFLCSVSDGRRRHFHISARSIQVSHDPPRMAVCFDKREEGARLVKEGAWFSLTLLATDQSDLALAVNRRTLPDSNSDPDPDPDELKGTMRRIGPGRYILPEGLGYFDCEPKEHYDFGDSLGVVAEVRDFGVLREGVKNLRLQDLVDTRSKGE